MLARVPLYLLLVTAAVTRAQASLIPGMTDAIRLDVLAEPREDGGVTHTARCVVKPTASITTTSLSLFVSGYRGGMDRFQRVASTDIWTGTTHLSEEFQDTDLVPVGEINSTNSHLTLTWDGSSAAPVPSYKCVARGLDSNLNPVTFSTSSKVSNCKEAAAAEAIMGSLMSKVESIASLTRESRKQVENVTEMLEGVVMKLDAMQRRELTSSSVDYDASDVFRGKVYLVSKNAAGFNIKAADERCMRVGGHLFEFNDAEEYQFVFDLVNRIGGANTFWTGANDIDEEGVFRFYHSKEKLTYFPLRPDNSGGHEDCIEIRLNFKGLNDWECHQAGKIVCEVPWV